MANSHCFCRILLFCLHTEAHFTKIQPTNPYKHLLCFRRDSCSTCMNLTCVTSPLPVLSHPPRGTEALKIQFLMDYITFFRSPKSTSVCMVLSWASSSMMMAYWVRSGSIRHSLSNIPSVMYLMTVSGLVQSSNRMV